ncbi:unnamed protein product [Closterium sp. NIES-53]
MVRPAISPPELSLPQITCAFRPSSSPVSTPVSPPPDLPPGCMHPQIRAPVKIFGDLHGQFGDLMRLFDEYGSPSTAGDIAYIDYLFLGDYVDRGQHSLETIILLLALKIEFPRNVHLIRGNHEAADINALFGFRMECIERMGEEGGIWAWHRINQLFNWLPLAALIEHKILCMHGGIGRSIQHVSQIEELKRPITMEAGSMVLMDLLWCVHGAPRHACMLTHIHMHTNALCSPTHVWELKRPITMEAGSMVLMDLLCIFTSSHIPSSPFSSPLPPSHTLSPLLIPSPPPFPSPLTYPLFSTLPSPLPLQPDRVMEFCHTNDLQLIIRAHECVMDGFERFAGGHLITLFSATNYCGE